MESARVPQHLELEDVVAWGLGAVDLLCVFVGAVLGWWLYLDLPDPAGLRISSAAIALLIGLSLGLIRLRGLALRTWIGLGVAFLARPRLFIAGGRR